ncbi:MAG: DNA-3-methyladenine glycosylase [Patescibacteria group bacterium]
MRLKRKFFERGAEEVGRDLLGKVLVREIRPPSPGATASRRKIRAIITETEAYVGEHDLASHARFGRTKRNEVMYGPAGTVYMYFIYGMYWMMNIVTGRVGDAQAVLIRGIRTPDENLAVGAVRVMDTLGQGEMREIGGPGKIAKHLHLDKSLYGEDLVTSDKLWVESSGKGIGGGNIVAMPRIGVSYAKDWKDRPLRFVLEKKEK